jgi:L-cysteine:1D-myo-inositol 2-amino-2-deoxy-alpha-D-glucopyranoside ligase
MVNRVWRDSGYTVVSVQNVTDIDDPLLERASKIGEDWTSIAQREILKFRDDMTALRVLPPTHYVTVTEHMDSIVAWIEKLLHSGDAYYVEKDIYFDAKSVTDRGAISHLDHMTMFELSEERGGDPNREGKRNALDPVLWKARKDGEPFWNASFGDGRPGWHIECVAIAADFAGRPLSVQGGGRDLVFPHHEMCHAQSVAIDGLDFAQHFSYVGMVHYQGAKMSKSLGNLVFISELVKSGIDPMAIRLAIISGHYRGDWEWTETRLHSAEQKLKRWRSALSMQAGADSMLLLADLRTALSDDLDIPRAISLIDAWADATLAGNTEDIAAQGIVSRSLDALLGLAL